MINLLSKQKYHINTKKKLRNYEKILQLVELFYQIETKASHEILTMDFCQKE